MRGAEGQAALPAVFTGGGRRAASVGCRRGHHAPRHFL